MTINDMDDRYYSQYFRRYGQNITEREIEELSLVSAVLTPFRRAPTPLQIITDYLTLPSRCSTGHTFLAAQLFISLLSQLRTTSANSEDAVSYTLLHNRLAAVTESLSSASNGSIPSLSFFIDKLAESYKFLEYIQDNTTAPSRQRSTPCMSMTDCLVLTQEISRITHFPRRLRSIYSATLSAGLRDLPENSSFLIGNLSAGTDETDKAGLRGYKNAENFDEKEDVKLFKEKLKRITEGFAPADDEPELDLGNDDLESIVRFREKLSKIYEKASRNTDLEESAERNRREILSLKEELRKIDFTKAFDGV